MKERIMIQQDSQELQSRRRIIFFTVAAVIFLTGSLIRLLFRDMTSLDSENFLVPWYQQIQQGGGFQMLGTQVGDYNILYQTMIGLFTYLPIPALYAYKLFSCIFDFLLAVLCSAIVYELTEKKKESKALLTFAAVYLSPIVMLNSAWWAQCDVIYTFFGLASVYYLSKGKDFRAVILYGFALTFKLQAIFLIPVLLFVIFYRNKLHLLYVILIPAVMILLSGGGLIYGRSIIDVFRIYLNQTATYPSVALNYPSVWGLLSDVSHLINHLCGENTVSSQLLYQIIKYPAILMTIGLLAGYMIYWLKKKPVLNAKTVFYIAFLLAYTCVIMLPGMHERYGYTYEILAIIIVFLSKKTLPLLLTMYSLTLITYVHFLSNCYFIPISVLSVINIIVYIFYAKHILTECVTGA